MLRVVSMACCLVGGALMGGLPGDLAPRAVTSARAQEWPVETAKATTTASVSAAPAAATPATNPDTKPDAKPAETPTAALPPAKPHVCAGVIGTSRTIVADASLPRDIGLMQFKTTLPLKDHEVVLTFDDGPVHTYTPRVLDILAKNCVKATFFIVGQQATAYPALVRRAYNDGNSIGTHSEHHPLTFNRMAAPAVAREVEDGIAAVQAAIGNPRAVAPFFRVPGLKISKTVDKFLAAHSLMDWSADAVADDWRHGITPAKIVKLAMARIAARDHRGVLLLHDIRPATVAALPRLLAELKAHGYRIVHVVPAGARPTSVPPLPKTLIAHAHPHKAARHRHVAHRARHRRHHHRKVTRRHRTHSRSLSALKHKKHSTGTVARNTSTSGEW
ncbi:MAG: polysaccharide deacetylase family protein [Pseudolabrys sp.]